MVTSRMTNNWIVSSLTTLSGIEGGSNSHNLCKLPRILTPSTPTLYKEVREYFFINGLISSTDSAWIISFRG